MGWPRRIIATSKADCAVSWPVFLMVGILLFNLLADPISTSRRHNAVGSDRTFVQLGFISKVFQGSKPWQDREEINLIEESNTFASNSESGGTRSRLEHETEGETKALSSEKFERILEDDHEAGNKEKEVDEEVDNHAGDLERLREGSFDVESEGAAEMRVATKARREDLGNNEAVFTDSGGDSEGFKKESEKDNETKSFIPEILLEKPKSSGKAPTCQNYTLWFIAMDNSGTGLQYAGFAQVAVMSAKQHAPCLIPNLIFDGPPNGFTRWFQEQGGFVHYHRLSFEWQLKILSVKQGFHKDGTQVGPYMRIDVPEVIQTAQYYERFASYGDSLDASYALYTDCDVIFMSHFDVASLPRPAIFSIGGERERSTLENTGVMFMNVTRFALDAPGIMEHGVATGWQQPAFDQGLLLEFYKAPGDLTQLPDRHNWKPYWGQPENGRPVIVHWHGPKPMRGVDCYVEKGFRTNRSVYEDCGSPEIYTDIYLSAPDGGALYVEALDRFVGHFVAANADRGIEYTQQQFFNVFS